MSCWWCKENKKSNCGCSESSAACNCKLEWRWEATVFMSDPQTRVVDVPHDPVVVSTDNTVSVDVSTEPYEDWTRPVYDLSVECCDSKVAVCVWDTNPWALVDKIEVVSPLTMDVTCGEKMVIWLDQTLITHPDYPDEKVARQAWCPERFLSGIVWLQDNFWWFSSADPITATELADDSCDKRYVGMKCSDADKCKPWRVQAWKLRLEQNVVEQQIAWPNWIWEEKFYIFLNWVTSTWSLSWVTAEFLNVNYSEELTMWWITYEDWGIKLCRDGYYRVWYTWSQEHSFWVNWVRSIVFAKEPWQPVRPLLENRLSPISDPWVPIAWTRPWVNYLTTAWWWTWLNAWFSFLERSPFSGTDIYKLRKDTVIFFWMKISSVIDDPSYDITRPAERAVLWKNAIGSWPSWDIWMQFHVESIDSVCEATEYANCNTCT